ncbi:MAG: hypothetical protein H0U27_01830 [Nitrosopumilus sp.]|nr:hypothetical protein [Nitrosopumilus sp.]
MTPILSYACGTMSENMEKSCCKTETAQADKKDCCNNSHSNKNNDDGCGGDCKDPSCHCPSINISIVLPFFSELACKDYFVEKQNFFEIETYISSGFHSIWLLPKIS